MSESLGLRTPFGHLAASGLHEQQLAVEREAGFNKARATAAGEYGKFFEVMKEGAVLFHPSQDCDEDGARS